MKIKVTLYERFEGQFVPIFEREIEHDSGEATIKVIEYNKRLFVYNHNDVDVDNHIRRYNEAGMIKLMPKDGKVLV